MANGWNRGSSSVERARQLRVLAGVVFVVIGTTQLAGCFPVLLAGAASTAYSVTDRRTVGAQADDKVIGVKAESRINEEFGDRVHINVTSFNRKVLLTGEVPDEAAKARVEKIANGVEDVTAVVNALEIAGNSSLTSRSSDAVITTRIKAQLVDTKDIFANAFKVVTERGTVYLMGRVTQAEGDRASETARTVPGVARVVKVYDYVTADELRQIEMDSHPGSAPPPKPAS